MNSQPQGATIGFGKGGKGVFSEKPIIVFFRDFRLENLEILEFLENPQTLESKGDCNRLLQILENLEIFRDSRDFSSGKTPFGMTFSSSPKLRW